MTALTLAEALEQSYRQDARRVLATLIRLLGGFDAAEEGLHEAFLAAATQWPTEGVPANPASWLVSVGRFKVLDRQRRQARLHALRGELAQANDEARDRADDSPPGLDREEAIADDELRLIFVCCHPALSSDARIALTLREVAGLTTEEIARAYLVSAPTIAQRIVRAKARIRELALPYDVPGRAELPGRLESVLQVIYLVFNEGYAATCGPALTRGDLCQEALRLGRLVVGLLDDPEARGLVALMLLHEARRSARVDASGDLVLLEAQARTRWDRALIAEAQSLIEQALAARRVGPYLLQAAIAALHAEAPTVEGTDWAQIVGLYDTLLRVEPSPVVALNRAAAVGRRDGATAGLAAVEAAMSGGVLDGYYLAHAARADLLRQVGREDEARACYERALALTLQPAEQRFLAGRLAALKAPV